MVVGKPCPKSYFDSLDGIHQNETQFSVEDVLIPDHIEACTRQESLSISSGAEQTT